MNESLTRAWSSLTLLPFAAKVILGVVVFVVLVAMASGLHSCEQHAADAKFDAAEAKREKERATQEAVTDAAIKRAEAAETRAQSLELEVSALKQVASDKALTVKQKDVEVRKIEDAITNSSVTPLDPAHADADVRERLRRLGYAVN